MSCPPIRSAASEARSRFWVGLKRRIRLALPVIMLAAFVPIIQQAAVPKAVADHSSAVSELGEFHVLNPSRILDTRDGYRTGTCDGYCLPIGPGQTLTFYPLGKYGVPSSGVSAVAVNITATGPTQSGWLLAHPYGVGRYGSTLNFKAGQTIANSATVRIGSGGRISLYNGVGTVHVLVDIRGYYTTAGQAVGSRFIPKNSVRIFDSRKDGYSLTHDAATGYRVTGVGGVLPGASAVVLNITATGGTAASYLTVYTGGGSLRPQTSDLNWVPGQTISNSVTARPDSDGWINIYNAAGTAHVIIEVTGFYQHQGSAYRPLQMPRRLSDTRGHVPLFSNTPRDRPVAGYGGVPFEGVAAVVLNITVPEATGPGHLKVYASDDVLPSGSTLNYPGDAAVAVQVVVRLSSLRQKAGGGDNPGGVTVLSSAEAHLVVDVVGWFRDIRYPATAPNAPVQSGNLLANGEFDNGTSNWLLTSATGHTHSFGVPGSTGQLGLSGTNGLVADPITGPGTLEDRLRFTMQQGPLTVRSGYSYKLTLLGMSPAATNYRLQARLINPTTKVVYYAKTIYVIDGHPGSYQPWPFVSSVTDTNVYLDLQFFSLTGGGSVMIDNVTLSESENAPADITQDFLPVGDLHQPLPRTGQPTIPTTEEGKAALAADLLRGMAACYANIGQAFVRFGWFTNGTPGTALMTNDVAGKAVYTCAPSFGLTFLQNYLSENKTTGVAVNCLAAGMAGVITSKDSVLAPPTLGRAFGSCGTGILGGVWIAPTTAKDWGDFFQGWMGTLATQTVPSALLEQLLKHYGNSCALNFTDAMVINGIGTTNSYFGGTKVKDSQFPNHVTSFFQMPIGAGLTLGYFYLRYASTAGTCWVKGGGPGPSPSPTSTPTDITAPAPSPSPTSSSSPSPSPTGAPATAPPAPAPPPVITMRNPAEHRVEHPYYEKYGSSSKPYVAGVANNTTTGDWC